MRSAASPCWGLFRPRRRPTPATAAEPMDWLEEELRDNDRRDFPGRLVRFREIDGWFQVPPGGFSLGPDFETGIALSEARLGYVNGFWLSAILMSLTAIERHLAWRLSSSTNAGSDRLPAQKLIELALDAGFVTTHEAMSINELRRYRNAYAHFRQDSRFLNIMFAEHDRQQRLWEALGDDDSVEGMDVNMILSADARTAVMLASAYFLVAGRNGLSEPEEPRS